MRGHNCFGSIGDTDLLENALHVFIDRSRTRREKLGNGSVRAALRDPVKDLVLASRETWKMESLGREDGRLALEKENLLAASFDG